MPDSTQQLALVQKISPACHKLLKNALAQKLSEDALTDLIVKSAAASPDLAREWDQVFEKAAAGPVGLFGGLRFGDAAAPQPNVEPIQVSKPPVQITPPAQAPAPASPPPQAAPSQSHGMGWPALLGKGISTATAPLMPEQAPAPREPAPEWARRLGLGQVDTPEAQQDLYQEILKRTQDAAIPERRQKEYQEARRAAQARHDEIQRFSQSRVGQPVHPPAPTIPPNHLRDNQAYLKSVTDLRKQHPDLPDDEYHQLAARELFHQARQYTPEGQLNQRLPQILSTPEDQLSPSDLAIRKMVDSHQQATTSGSGQRILGADPLMRPNVQLDEQGKPTGVQMVPGEALRNHQRDQAVARDSVRRQFGGHLGRTTPFEVPVTDSDAAKWYEQYGNQDLKNARPKQYHEVANQQLKAEPSLGKADPALYKATVEDTLRREREQYRGPQELLADHSIRPTNDEAMLVGLNLAGSAGTRLLGAGFGAAGTAVSDKNPALGAALMFGGPTAVSALSSGARGLAQSMAKVPSPVVPAPKPPSGAPTPGMNMAAPAAAAPKHVPVPTPSGAGPAPARQSVGVVPPPGVPWIPPVPAPTMQLASKTLPPGAQVGQGVAIPPVPQKVPVAQGVSPPPKPPPIPLPRPAPGVPAPAPGAAPPSGAAPRPGPSQPPPGQPPTPPFAQPPIRDEAWLDRAHKLFRGSRPAADDVAGNAGANLAGAADDVAATTAKGQGLWQGAKDILRGGAEWVSRPSSQHIAKELAKATTDRGGATLPAWRQSLFKFLERLDPGSWVQGAASRLPYIGRSPVLSRGVAAADNILGAGVRFGTGWGPAKFLGQQLATGNYTWPGLALTGSFGGLGALELAAIANRGFKHGPGAVAADLTRHPAYRLSQVPVNEWPERVGPIIRDTAGQTAQGLVNSVNTAGRMVHAVGSSLADRFNETSEFTLDQKDLAQDFSQRQGLLRRNLHEAASSGDYHMYVAAQQAMKDLEQEARQALPQLFNGEATTADPPQPPVNGEATTADPPQPPVDATQPESQLTEHDRKLLAPGVGSMAGAVSLAASPLARLGSELGMVGASAQHADAADASRLASGRESDTSHQARLSALQAATGLGLGAAGHGATAAPAMAQAAGFGQAANMLKEMDTKLKDLEVKAVAGNLTPQEAQTHGQMLEQFRTVHQTALQGNQQAEAKAQASGQTVEQVAKDLTIPGSMAATTAVALIAHSPEVDRATPNASPEVKQQFAESVWGGLPDWAKWLVYGGVGLAAVSMLASFFGGGEDDEEGKGGGSSLMSLAPLLGLGAAGVGLSMGQHKPWQSSFYSGLGSDVRGMVGR